MGDDKDGWKSFSNNTETGRLLRRLYGLNDNSGTINNYPKNRPMKKKQQQELVKVDWKLGKDSEVTFNKSKANSIKVPKVGRNKENDKDTTISPIDCMPKRKNASDCLKQIDNNIMLRSNYRPPPESCIYSEYEKDKLNEIFTFKGGCALPRELTHPEGPLPSELRAINQSLKQTPKNERAHNTKDVLFDQIWDEIQERKKFQGDMKKTGYYDSSTQQKIELEIMSRCGQLKEINADRANYLIKKHI